MGIVEKIKEIEKEMSRTQKNKATEGHLGGLKVRPPPPVHADRRRTARGRLGPAGGARGARRGPDR